MQPTLNIEDPKPVVVYKTCRLKKGRHRITKAVCKKRRKPMCKKRIKCKWADD